MSTTNISGSLITRNYTGFLGVDFTHRYDEVALTRSPDSSNMYKNYKNSNGKCIETRPGLKLLDKFSDEIYGLFFYTINDVLYRIIHAGRVLYRNDKPIYTKMSFHKSVSFIYNNILYILDGEHYLRYDGVKVTEVEGYIPTTSISRNPAGGGKIYEDINLLQSCRKNSFCSDGKSTEYVLDVEYFDEDSEVIVWVDDEIVTNYTYDYLKGIITFEEAPVEPLTPGADNVVIQFKKTVKGYRDRISKCTLVEVFDNRVFYSGNDEHPNMLWHCSLDNPEYCSDLDYYAEGTVDSKIMSIASGNNALWVMKEPSQSNTTLFYHTPTVDDTYGKTYPNKHSSISTGCVTSGLNFMDSISFFSDRGMEVVTNEITKEQVLRHTSSLIDNKLLNEKDYNNMILAQWEGYLMVIVGKNIYLCDGRQMVYINDHYEFEWFFWEFDEEIIGATVKDRILYLITKEEKNKEINYKISSLNDFDNNRDINSYWCTIADEFKYPQYQKTTNKKGCVIDIEGQKINVSVKIDSNNFMKIKEYKNVKGYVVSRIKKKKWKSIQLLFSSNKPFNLYSATLEAYIGSYVKR